MPKKDPRITKRRVVMTSARAVTDPNGKIGTITTEAVDYVRPDFLDAYVSDAQTRWDTVTVSDEPDAGPGGYDGATRCPETLDHPQAGEHYPAYEKG